MKNFLSRFLLLSLVVLGFANLCVAQFPKSFLWGVGNAEHQVSDVGPSNWTAFQNKPGAVKNGDKPGNTVDFWHRYKEDIAVMQTLGINSLRFSIDWSMIEPQEGVINHDAIKHYHELLDALKEANITPMVTLHHFTHPLWFEEKGGWTKEENIGHFVNFSKLVFGEFNQKVKLWATINEPAIYAFSGYLLGIHSPGIKMNIQKTLNVLKHLMQAHVATYKSLKVLPGGQEAQIGIVHNFLVFTKLYTYDPIATGLSKLFTKITNDLTMEFLGTGNFKANFWKFGKVLYSDETAVQSFDWLGLNYYARPVVGPNRKNIYGDTHFADQVMGDMNLPVDPDGFGQALESVAKLGKPIYITENGMADNKDDRRPTMIRQYLGVLKEKISKGLNILGYFHWTLVKNFEWHEGNTKDFGLCTPDREIKESGYVYRDLIREYMQTEGLEPVAVGIA